jgi:hypothetical protein
MKKYEHLPWEVGFAAQTARAYSDLPPRRCNHTSGSVEVHLDAGLEPQLNAIQMQMDGGKIPLVGMEIASTKR